MPATTAFNASLRGDSRAFTSSHPAAEPSMASRYGCAAIMVAVISAWYQYTFVKGDTWENVDMHDWRVPVGMNLFYVGSLPVLNLLTSQYLGRLFDMKVLLKEAMIVYNVAQVVINGWMVYKFIDALVNRGHPFIGGDETLVHTGTTYALWVHYCDKYLEYLDTYFMVLRGRMDQVSFLHVYHHTTISAAWWFALTVYPGGDAYFGGLLNSFIHVLMYSYYAMALLKISCPWKRYLTQAQLLQFCTVMLFTIKRIVQPGLSRNGYMACSVQLFEMMSLFVLFTQFYRTTYSNKSGKSDKSNNAKVEEQRILEITPDDACEPDTVSSDGSDDDQEPQSL